MRNILIGGGGTIVNESGRCLRKFLLDNLDLEIMKTDGPTRVCATSASYTDIFMIPTLNTMTQHNNNRFVLSKTSRPESKLI